jgi:hypothetical protein
LIDAYVRDELDPGDRPRFERRFLTAPERRENVAFAGILNACLSSRTRRPAISQAPAALPSTPAPFPSRRRVDRRVAGLYFSTAAALALAAVAAFLLIETAGMRKQIERFQAERLAIEQREESLERRLTDEIAHSKGLVKELERARAESSRVARELSGLRRSTAGRAQGRVVLALLAPGQGRSEEQPARVKLSPGAGVVRLSLALRDSSYDRYAVAVQTVEGQTLLTRTDLKPQVSRNTVVITLPARMLTRSTYLIRLSGINAGGQKMLDTYFFNIVRK